MWYCNKTIKAQIYSLNYKKDPAIKGISDSPFHQNNLETHLLNALRKML